MGVKSAILKTVHELNKNEEDIFVYGPLIHNPQTMSVLNERGLKVIKELSSIKNKNIAIRTHGIPIEETILIKEKAKNVLNLTCPRVAKVQSIIKKHTNLGYYTIIAGDHNHAEVVGLKSFAKESVTIVSQIDDIKKIPRKKKYIVVSQTTFEKSLFNEIVKELKQSFKKNELKVFDTICDSTRDRQQNVFDEIEKGINTLVVVGGKNSANTTRLAMIGKYNKIKTIHIETESELKESYFTSSDNILVTAGASTPGWIINNVLEKLVNIKYNKSNFLIRTFKNIIEFLVRTSLFASIASFFISALTQFTLLNFVDKNLAFITSLYLFSMYSINNYFDRKNLKSSNLYKYNIYNKFGHLLLFLSFLAIGSSLFLIRTYGITEILILILSYSLGIIYSTSFFRSFMKIFKINIISKIYTSRIATSLGWSLIISIIPFLIFQKFNFLFLAITFFIFTMIFLRQILLDQIAFQGDLILGRESLPVMLGFKKTFCLSSILIALSSIFILLSSFYAHIFYINIFLVNNIYTIYLLKKISKMDYLIYLKYEILVDLNFITPIIVFFLIV